MKLKELFDEAVHDKGVHGDCLIESPGKGADTKSMPNENKSTESMPEPLPDPHGVAFTDEELDALTDLDSEEAVKLAYARSTPDKQALLGAKAKGE